MSFVETDNIMNNKVKIMRVIKGMSQKDLARQVGITRQTMGLIEREQYNPSLKLCVRIAKVLGTDLNTLFWEVNKDEE